MRLALSNLLHDRLRFVVTVTGITFAVFLMVFQGSLIAGFMRAASRPIQASDAQLWVTGRGVRCFEYPTPIPDRFRDLAYCCPGVESVQRVVGSFARWMGPSGTAQYVYLVGAEAGMGGDFPVPYTNDRRDGVLPESILVDVSSAAALEVTTMPVDLEMNYWRANAVGTIRDFGTFLGTPYAFTGYWDAVRYIGVRPEQTYLLAVHLRPGSNVQAVKRVLAERLPEADVWTRDEFAHSAAMFWIIRTGAGGALLTAALLGFVVGLVVVSQNIYATTMENLEEYATLKAIGATRGYIRRVVLIQALASGVIGSALGIVLVFPASSAIKGFVSWVYTPIWLPLAMVGAGLLMCCLASIVSIRKALSVEPARVFRA
jgi:putative ABC transport system permease protein